MNQILKDLWHGDVAPCERCGVGNARLNRLVGDIERTRKALFDILSKQQTEQLEAYKGLLDDYSALVCEEAFTTGFRLGAQITAAALLKK